MASRYRKKAVLESEAYKYVSGLSMEQKIAFYQKEARKANKRIVNLEKAGIQSIPYKELARTQEKPRFYTGKKISEKDIDRKIRDVLIFTEAKTSSVSGYRKEFKNRIETLRRNHPDWFEDSKITDTQLMQLFEAGAFSSERFGDSSQTIESGVKMIKSKEDFDKVYKAFTNSENTTLFEAKKEAGLGAF